MAFSEQLVLYFLLLSFITPQRQHTENMHKTMKP